MAAIQTHSDRAALRVVNDLYNAAAESRADKRNVRHYLGMSEIGGPCDRALWYSFRGYPQRPIDGRVMMLFRFGDRVEEELIFWLNRAGYHVDGQQDGFSDHAGLFRGHCDGVVHNITSSPHILECKSCNKRSFESFKLAGVVATQPKYYAQATCYMGYSGLDRALVAIQCKDDSALYFERLYFNQSDFDALRQRALSIITANTPPDKPFDEGSNTCGWCNYRPACWWQEESVMDNKVCGTCHFFAFKGLTKVCRHPQHVVEIMQWGIGCPEWLDATSKDPVLIQPVELESVKL